MRVAVIGHGSTIERENLDWAVEDTVFYTVQKALKQSNLSIDEIDTVIQAGDDILDGMSINHVLTVEPAGSFLKEESKVERDGAWAVHYAIARLLSGKFKTAMVVAQSKGTQCGLSAFSGISADPFYLRPVGVDATSAAALQAGYFSSRTKATEKDFAEVARKNRKNGQQNDRVMKGEAGDYTVEQILKSKPVATPIRELNYGRVGDGCVVLILSTEDYAKKTQRNASYITGAGFISDVYYPTYRDLSRVKSAEKAAEVAYKMAGISSHDVQFAEVHENYAHQEMMLYEAMGFCKDGEAVPYFKSGATQSNGALPVNQSGGVTCGHIIYASGLARLMECHLQLTGQAGKGQLKNVKRALAHSQAGLAMQANIVYIMES